MAAPCRQSFYQILRRQFLKKQNHFDKSFNRNLSFTNFSSKNGSFKSLNTKSVKVIAGIVGLSSVFVTKAVWNTVVAASPVTNQAVSNVEEMADKRGSKLTLYQFQSCPFCCKVRAALDYYGFSYNVVEVNSVTRTQLKFSEYKKVPVLVYEGDGGEKFVSMNDSSVIISMLVSHMFDPSVDLATLKTYYPAIEEETKKGKKKWDFPNRYFIMYGDSIADTRTEKQRNNTSTEFIGEERKWRAWVDDHLVHMISPNVYRTPSESLEAFHHFSEWGQWDKNFSTLNRLLVVYVGAPVMYIIGKVVKHRHNLKEDVRLSLYEACDDWMKALEKKKYLGGEEPCIADLNVYGVLHSFEGCQAFKDLMANSRIKKFYNRIEQDIKEHKGAVLNHASIK